MNGTQHFSKTAFATIGIVALWVAGGSPSIGQNVADRARHFDGKISTPDVKSWLGAPAASDLASRRITISSDTNYCLAEETREEWNGSEWVPTQRRLKTCDASGRDAEVVDQEWNGAQWVNTTRQAATYDASGNAIEWTRQEWDGGKWVNTERDTYAYDGSGNAIEYVSHSWESWGDGQWVSTSRSVTTFDANGNITELVSQLRDGSQWVNFSRDARTYDAAGNWTGAEYQTWDGSQWIDLFRGTTTYDSSGYPTESVSQASLDGVQFSVTSRETYYYEYNFAGIPWLIQRETSYWNDTEWVNGSRHTNIYDVSGNLTLSTYEAWNGSEWVNLNKSTIAYDATGQMTEFVFQQWINSEWVNLDMFTVTYDAMSRNVGTVGRIWQNGQWVDVSRSTRIYVDIAVAIEGTPGRSDAVTLGQNYPNPFYRTTDISYTIPETADVTLTVVDLLGRQVRVLASGTLSAGTHQISFDGSDLPAGIYFYRLEAGNVTETKRMVVVK